MHPTPPDLPAGNGRIRIVRSLEELVTTRFAEGVNALCWPRVLRGDFSEVLRHVPEEEDMVSLDEEILRSLPLGAGGREAVTTLLGDLENLRAAGLAPGVDCIRRYPRDDPDPVVSTDVYSFHADSATVEADTVLCTYAGAPSEGVGNEEALRCIDVPETRAGLLRRFGGADDAAFQAYLREQCYDLHYVAIPGARVFSFGVGHVWRIAIEYPGCPVPPCIHRAPEDRPDLGRRLLLIS